jgi:Rod binding domain-containing protein
MSLAGFSPVLVDPKLMAGQSPPTSAAELAKRGQIKETAQKFEASFLSSMMQEMFEGVEVAAPFGGGEGEKMFRSFLTEAMAKQMTRSGGIGITAQVQREMLKMQGLK